MLKNFCNKTLFSCFIVTLFACTNVAATTSNIKTVLITGGLSGIGKELTLAFKNDGWDVWATSRDPLKHADIPGVNVRKLDLTNEQAVKQLIKEIQNKSGRLDVLVNNAGYGILGPEEAVSMAQVRELMDVNFIGPLMLTQQALPIMRQNNRGHIINISSTSGVRALPGLGVYAASKMALEGISEALAAELAPWNISVSIIEPGTVNNDWVKNSPLAANLNEFPGYKKFTSKLQQSLAAKAAELGQKPSEVAQLALTIAKTDKPNLRYQSNKQSATIVSENLADPTGNATRDKMISYAKEFYELPTTF